MLPRRGREAAIGRGAAAAGRTIAGGRARSSTGVAYLVDSNVLVYRHDARFPSKQARATRLLRKGIESGEARLAHQAIVEFVAAVTRPLAPGGRCLLEPQEAREEAESLLAQFPIVYPNEQIVRLALRGSAAYGLSWFDAHMWAYAELNSFSEIYSEDFQHDRMYGTVRVVNPFLSV
jgi:predicted nucleic acid-binding protein